MNNNLNVSGTVLPKIRKHNRMMDDYKKAANPFYAEDFGISLNNVNFWQKNVAMQYITVWAGGSSFTFAGLNARSILFNLGDKDNEKFNELTPEQSQLLQDHFNPPVPAPVVPEPVSS